MMIHDLYTKFKGSSGVCTDTRQIKPQSIFFALKGDHFNGNEFALQALENGVSYCVVDEPAHAQDDRCILVPDVLSTLQELARYHRDQLSIPIIGITGSNGKTTTKELMREVLSKRYSTFATAGNLNNHIGVPLSLLSITPEHEIAIIEMGANHPGEIKFLCEIADPDYGLITNIGKAHIEGFGSFEGVLNTKKELYDHLETRHGVLFINSGDEILQNIAPGLEKHTYSTLPGSDISGTVTKADPFISLTWQSEEQTHSINTRLVGSYNLLNILAAITVGTTFLVDSDAISSAIAEYVPDNNRSQVKQTDRNTLIMDAYNANPTSMKAALENLMLIKADKKLAILGDMLELGPESKVEHEKIDALLHIHHMDVVLVGKEFSAYAKHHKVFPSTEEAGKYLWDRQTELTGYTVLLKGSRGIRLENLLEYL